MQKQAGRSDRNARLFRVCPPKADRRMIALALFTASGLKVTKIKGSERAVCHF
jgi:hypothetical protein